MISYTDPSSESRALPLNYVPRDESFSGIKTAQFGAKALYSALHGLIPTLKSAILDPDRGFPHFPAIDSLFKDGINLPDQKGLLTALPRLLSAVNQTGQSVLRYETTDPMESKCICQIYVYQRNQIFY